MPDPRINKDRSMKRFRELVGSAFISGSLLLLFKAMQSVAGLVRPLAMLLPEWLPAEHALSLLLILIFCFLIGVAIRTPAGRVFQEQIEKSLFERIPGYALFRSLAQRIAGKEEENVWKPALAEIEDALVPAFIIEELDDGRLTVFVPSVPTPFAGAVYVLAPQRVHPLNVSFTQAIQSVSRWGSGSKQLVAAMTTEKTVK
jgi:uncharacterized membrane protein